METNEMNVWRSTQSDNLKQAFSLLTDMEWEKVEPDLQIGILDYCRMKKAGSLTESMDRSMLNEIVCGLTDMRLCRLNGKTLEDMCDTEGNFMEKYQEQFNGIYDELEKGISDYMNKQK